MEDRKESIKKALLTIKKECSRYDECEDGQCIVLELLPSLDICPLYHNSPEDWEIEEYEYSNSRCNNHSGYWCMDSE